MFNNCYGRGNVWIKVALDSGVELERVPLVLLCRAYASVLLPTGAIVILAADRTDTLSVFSTLALRRAWLICVVIAAAM